MKINKTFNAIVAHIRENPAQGAALGAALLCSTALTSPLLATGAGAAALLAGGLAALYYAGEAVIGGAQEYGRKSGIAPMTMGLMLGGLHAVPEFTLSLGAIANGAYDLAASHVVGSNIAHTLLILGAAGAAASIPRSKSLSWKFNTLLFMGASAVFGVQMLTGKLSPAIGAGMLAAGAYYLYKRYYRDPATAEPDLCGHSHGHEHEHGHDHCHHNHDALRPASRWLSAAWALAGMGGLWAASRMVVGSASALGAQQGLDNTLIGALPVAIGTVLPELATTLTAIRRKQTDLAIGNVVGCNLANILIAGGVVSLSGADLPSALTPETPAGILNLAAYGGSTLMMTGVLFANKGGMKRWQGLAALALYAAYSFGALNLGGDGKNPVLHDHDHNHLQAPAPIRTPVP